MPQETSGNVIADRRFAMALQFRDRGESEAAADLLEQTMELVPDWPVLHFYLGELYTSLARRDDAVKAFSRYLVLDPQDRLGGIIKLSLLGATPHPDGLPTGYIENLFDDYATRFDNSLVKNLEYRVPWVLAETIEKIRPRQPGTAERILDLGCGTGLAGEAIANRAAWLEGVDMSAGMLAQAENKKIYHYTAQNEAVSFLTVCDKFYDIILAADVLVYMGALEALFGVIYQRLSPGGLFAFSTQILEHGAYLLGTDHRYAHNPVYLQTCATTAGLACLHMEKAFIRHDGPKEIFGQIVVLCKPAMENMPLSFYPATGTRRRPRK